MNKFKFLNKKSLCFLTIFLVIFSALGFHFSYAKEIPVESENTLLSLDKGKFYAGDTFNLNVDFSALELQNFTLEISSSSTLENASVSIEEGLSTSLNSGALLIEGTKSLLSSDKLVICFTIPSDTIVGTEIKINAKISSNEEEVTSESISLTVLEKENSNSNNANNDNNPNPFENNEQKENLGISNMNSTLNTGNILNASADISSKSSTSSISANALNVSSIKEETITYNGSDNNYLSSLEVSGYRLNTNFTKTNTSYFITISSEVSSLDISALAESSLSTVCVYGNDNLSSGTNKILITVTSESCRTKTYRVFVTKD